MTKFGTVTHGGGMFPEDQIMTRIPGVGPTQHTKKFVALVRALTGCDKQQLVIKIHCVSKQLFSLLLLKELILMISGTFYTNKPSF